MEERIGSLVRPTSGRICVLGLIAVTASGCWNDPLVEATPEDRITVVEDPILLDERIEYLDVQLEIEDPSLVSSAAVAVGIPSSSAAQVEPVRLKLIAEVAPPELSGIRLQATHVATQSNTAYVSYNVQGPVFRGAIDAFDDMDTGTPALTSSMRFHDADVSAVAYSSSSVYLATGVVEGSFPTTAVLEVVPLRDGNRRFGKETRRVELPSSVGTGVTVFNNLIYVTAGDGGPVPGGLSVFDEDSLEPVTADPFADARAVSADGDRVVALRGSPAELRIYDKDFAT
ncbi:MAG: hypothetical protein ACR2QM_05745, partial [Longimicrobiales bacterium]